MSHPYYHSLSSQKKYGGTVEDYIDIHSWFDESKQYIADSRHRALRHHAQGIFECEIRFGKTFLNSEGKEIPTRAIGEQHVLEDMGGRIPSLQDWLSNMSLEKWMSRGAKNLSKEFEEAKEADNAHS